MKQLSCDIRWADIVIQHVGYQDPALRARKLQRDLRLLQLDDTEQPDDPFMLSTSLRAAATSRWMIIEPL